MVLLASRFDLQVTKPMYPGRLVKLVSAVAGPSSNLLYHCHKHTQIKLFSFQIGVQRSNHDGSVSRPLTLLPACSFALYSRILQLPRLWTSSSLALSEWMCEVPNISINVNKPSLLLVCRIIGSWLNPGDKPLTLSDTLLDDLFPLSGEPRSQQYPLIELGLCGLEIKVCHSCLVQAYTASLSSIQLFLYRPGVAGRMSVLPVLYGPTDTRHVCSGDLFTKPSSNKQDVRSDCVTITLQTPKHTEKNEAQALVLLDSQGFAVCLDPGLISWFHYLPQPRVTASPQQTPVVVDLSLAQLTSPLNTVYHASVHSTSSPSHTGRSRQTPSLPQPSLAEETKGTEPKKTFAEKLADLFPFVRMLHVQIEIKSSSIIIPKTSLHTSESTLDILTLIQQAKQAGRLSDTLVVCLPSISLNSTMTKPMSFVQELPVTSIQGSLIGEKLPWTMKITNLSVYSVMSESTDLHYFLCPLDTTVTLAVTCKYHPPTSENISSLSLCYHVDVEQPKIEITSSQIHLFTLLSGMIASLTGNILQLSSDLGKLFAKNESGKESVVTSEPQRARKKSFSSSNKCDVTISAVENQSEDVATSVDTSPLHESLMDDLEETTTKVKVTLWLQLMMPKIQIRALTSDKGVLVSLDNVDVTVDSQSVYCKSKVTVVALNVSHYHLTPNTTWSVDDPMSTVVSSNELIPRSLQAVSSKVWGADTSLSVGQHMRETVVKDKKHGFLTLIFTRALCGNVKKRMRRNNIELSSVHEIVTDEDTDISIQEELYIHEYLSEVCLSLEAIDFVLKQDLLVTLGQILSPTVQEKTKVPRGRAPSTKHSEGRQGPAVSRSTLMSLPLIYADIGTVRVFIPRHDDTKTTSELTCEERMSSVHHNMLVAVVSSTHIQPHADNPLPRRAVNKDLYHYSVQTGMTSQPGSVVEDKQYQLDVRGLSLYTGSWGQVLQEIDHSSSYRQQTPSSMVQIPALEWNNFLMGSISKERANESKLIPLISPFDVCLVVAPPIVYAPPRNREYPTLKTKPSLVCSLSMEVNVTCDLDLYLSSSQLELVFGLVCDVSSCLRTSSSTHTISSSPVVAKSPDRADARRRQKESIVPQGGDSGVESDLSTLTFDQNRILSKQVMTGQISEKLQTKKDETKSSNNSDLLSAVALCDLLLTAGRISVTLYSHKKLTEKLTVETSPTKRQDKGQEEDSQRSELATFDMCDELHIADNLQHLLQSKVGLPLVDDEVMESAVDQEEDLLEGFTTFSFMKPATDENTKKEIPTGSVCIYPFTYLYVTQPHLILANHSRSEGKLEISCYDVLWKGASRSQVSLLEENHILPECSDYNVHWLDTRAGQPDTHTGIPPSVLTARWTKQQDQTSILSISVDRPLRVQTSQQILHQILEYTHDLADRLPVFGSSSRDPANGSQKQSPQNRTGLCLPERLEFQSSQIVFELDMDGGDFGKVGFQLSVEEADLQVDLTQQAELLDRVDGRVSLKDLTLKLIYSNSLRPMLDPVTIEVLGDLSWIRCNNQSIPQLRVNVDSSIIQTHLGQEHLFCVSELVSLTSTFIENVKNKHPTLISGNRTSLTSQEPETTDKAIKSRQQEVTSCFIQDLTHDDLRTGGFILCDKSDARGDTPEPMEIVFSTGSCDLNSDSSMTWCYPQPRTITNVQLTPVPFNLNASNMSLSSTSSTTAVPCILQYYNDLTDKFEFYTDFGLSELDSVTVAMPTASETNRKHLVSSRVWKVLLLPSLHSFESPNELPVLPASLAACMCVDSAFIPSIIPSLRLSVSVPALQMLLANHMEYNGQDVPKDLCPYKVCHLPVSDMVFAIVKLSQLSMQATHTLSTTPSTTCTVCTSVNVKILENRHLTMEDVIEPVDTSLYISMDTHKQGSEMSIKLNADSLTTRIDRCVAHTLAATSLAWTTFSPRCTGPLIIIQRYLICNNTSSTIRIGQAGTDEKLAIPSLHVYPYSWRSPLGAQMLHLCMDQPSWKWTDPLPLDGEATLVRKVNARDQSYTVIVKVKRLSGTQIKVTIYGQFTLTNCLSQPVQVRIGQPADRGEPSKSLHATQLNVQACERLASIVWDEAVVSPVQFRLTTTSIWSHEVYISGERMKDKQMVKISLPGSQSFFHVWCHVFYQHFKDTVQRTDIRSTATIKMIVLSPLYVVRTHLPHPLFIHLDSPKVKESQQLMVKSKGQEVQLHCRGNDDIYHLSFRLGTDLSPSSPPVVLSTGIMEQLDRTPTQSMDLETFLTSKLDSALSWPYLDGYSSNPTQPGGGYCLEQKCQAQSLEHSEVEDPQVYQQTSVDLNLKLSEYIPGCDTLLVDVCPSILLTNTTQLDIIIKTDEGQWLVKPGHTLAPNIKQSTFDVNVKDGDVTSDWRSVPISDESKDYRLYNNEIGKMLFIDGYVHLSFHLPSQIPDKSEIAFLTITSDVKHNIRVIGVTERFVLVDNTAVDLSVKLLALPLGCKPVRMSHTETVEVTTSAKVDKGQGQGLLKWSTPRFRTEEEKQEEEASGTITHVYYVSFTDNSCAFCSDSQPEVKWSTPVRVISSKDGHRMTTSIPRTEAVDLDSQRCVVTSTAACVTTHLKNGVTYITVLPDKSPVCLIENICDFPVEFGQASDAIREVTVQEQLELVTDLPLVMPAGWRHYTMPALNSDLVTVDTYTLPKLHFRPATIDGKEEYRWSVGVQVQGVDAFVKFPDFCDVKALFQMVGDVLHIILRPVTNTEVTAKEIRNRLTKQGREKSAETLQENPQNKTTENVKNTDSKLTSTENETKEDSKLKPLENENSLRFHDSEKSQAIINSELNAMKISFCLLCEDLTVLISHETQSDNLENMLGLNAKDVFLSSIPLILNPGSVCFKRSHFFSVKSLQVDNMMYGTGSFDFPVVLIPQTNPEPEIDLCVFENTSPIELTAIMKSNSFLFIKIIQFRDLIWKNSCLGIVEVSLQPLALYVEDLFLYKIMEELEGFTPSSLLKIEKTRKSNSVLQRRIPDSVKYSAYILSQPMKFRELKIQPIKLLLSVHASLKLFLAADQSPLSLGKFERENVFCSQHRLMHALTIHYASAAIFRAGLVVGSLEILGNPTGLVRSIGTGVSDFVRLPYSGLTRGPAAFIGGVTQGVGSLVRNISAGMIASVTNFASSLSRNMDRLSLDSSHQERQEAKRRHRPQGVSAGLVQGLTGFGLSLLGAVAGIADQPIQTILSSGQGERPATTTAAAAGLVTGLGKGLVGVFTKPIGGAAELVSQTGQGLLHGTGLGQLPRRVCPTETRSRRQLDTSTYKYSLKFLTSLSTSNVLLVIPATTGDLLGSEVRVELLLTLDCVVVVSEDEQQQLLSLSELECRGQDGRLTLTWVDHCYNNTTLKKEHTSTDRVAAFIDSTSSVPYMENLDATHENSELLDSPRIRLEEIGSTCTSPQYHYNTEPDFCALFVTMVSIAKNQVEGRGFRI